MKCRTCEFECSSADLYFDHLLFDSRHFEMEQKRLKEQDELRQQQRRTRSTKRQSLLAC
ncbi:hypothetical protein GQ54DRAFT_259086 [Martensiomyces pterosporus]|nr:hypothetical protein GQ54DRAFT_259086 [Martensiomyces pterosporus]